MKQMSNGRAEQEVSNELPTSALPKKELTPAQLQKRRKRVVMPLFFLVFGAILWLIFAPSSDKARKKQGLSPLNVELPTPREEGIISDKKDAYEREAMHQREEEKMRDLQDFSAMLAEPQKPSPEEYARQLRMAPRPIEYCQDPSRFEGGESRHTSAPAIHSSANAWQNVNRQLETWREEPAAETGRQEQLALEARIEELERRLEEKEQIKDAQDEQLALIERSYQIASQYLPADKDAPSPAPPVAATKPKVAPVQPVRHEVASLLAAPMSDADFVQQMSQVRNWDFNTPTQRAEAAERNTINAVVQGEQSVVDGQCVRLRLVEPMQAGAECIPANSLLTGVAKLQGERLDITVSCVGYGGELIPVSLVAYDLDGQRGLFIPGSLEMEAAKEIAANAGANLGSSINISQQDAGQQLLTDLGRGVIQGTSAYLSKKIRQVRVTLKAGCRVALAAGEEFGE